MALCQCFWFCLVVVMQLAASGSHAFVQKVTASAYGIVQDNSGSVIEVGYSGSRTLHMMRSRDINQGPLSADVADGKITAASRQPCKAWGRISHREQSYSSVYHGLQAGLNRRFHAGLGRVTSARSPRTMQLSMRITF